VGDASRVPHEHQPLCGDVPEGTPAKLAEVEGTARAAGLRTRRTGTSISILGVEGADGRAPAGDRRPANLEDVFVLLTGEEID
jgi:lipooligosaccharide transport system ATP-binding protein